MTQEEWETINADVKNQMAKHVAQFCTPISMSDEPDSGVAWGSGGYIAISGKTYLVTAGHVFTDLSEGGVLAHLPTPGDKYIAITEQPELERWPVDAAAVRVPPIPEDSDITALPIERVADRYSAVESELMFWIGSPGYRLERHDPITPNKRRHTLFGELNTLSFPFLGQALQGESPNHECFDPVKHVAIHYPNYAKREPSAPPIPLPNAKGMSGSLLWNTRFLELYEKGIEWSPEEAVVCGVIWAALDDPEVLIATKIEFVRESLKDSFAGSRTSHASAAL